jgi:hypothetical protein
MNNVQLRKLNLVIKVIENRSLTLLKEDNKFIDYSYTESVDQALNSLKEGHLNLKKEDTYTLKTTTFTSKDISIKAGKLPDGMFVDNTDNINHDNKKLNTKVNEVKSITDTHPGGGKRIRMNASYNSIPVLVWLDSGSTTSLVTKEFVETHNLRISKSRYVVNLDGVFGTGKPLGYCIVTFEIDEHKVAFPAYVTSSLPGNDGDILVGMDQMGPGNPIGLHIPRRENNKITVVLFDADKETELKLSLNESKILNLYVNDDKSSQPLSREGDSNLMRNHTDNSLKDKAHPTRFDNEFISKLTDRKMQENLGHRAESDSLKEQIEDLSFINLNGDESDKKIKILIQLKQVSNQLKRCQNKFNDISKDIKDVRDKLQLRSRKFPKTSLKEKLKSLQNLRSKELGILNDLSLKKDSLSKIIRNIDRDKSHQEEKEKKNIVNQNISNTINNTSKYSLTGLTESIPSEVDDKREAVMFTSISSTEERDLSKHIKEDIIRYRRYQENISTEVREEICTMLKATLSVDNTLDNSIAEWRDNFEEDDNFKFIFDGIVQYHQLSEPTSAKFLLLKNEYIDVLALNPKDIPMGQATLGGEPLEFDEVNLLDCSDKFFQNPALRKPYNFKKPALELLKTTLDEMQRVGVGEINPREFKPRITSPGFLVHQKDKSRFCVDYRILNANTENFVFPLPNIDTLLESLAGCAYFSVMDLKSGYHQIRLSKRAQQLMANITPLGVFKYTCLSFGPKNAPAFFQKVMYTIFIEHIGIFVFVYIDDIVVFSKTEEDHLRHIEIILKLLRKSNFKVNIDKCKFFVSKLKVLGKIISRYGIEVDPDLIQSMRDFPTPINKTKVRSFLGLTGVYMQFIKDFQMISQPLRELTHNDTPFVWTEVHTKAFLYLKEAMLKSPILAYPDFSLDFHIQSDASLFGAGGVLYQTKEEGLQQIVAYASWLFSSTERKYHTSEREMLALINCLKKWKPFFWGRSIHLETDHKALQGVLKLNDPFGRIARWMLELNQFNCNIDYIPGEQNVLADAMSRIDEQVAPVLESNADVNKSNSVSLCNISKAIAQSVESSLCEVDICIKESVNAILDYSPLKDDDWCSAQRKDPEILPFILYLEDKKLPDDNNLSRKILNTIKEYEMRNKVIYRLSKVNKRIIPCIWVPRSLRKEVLLEFHDSIWSGAHMGSAKTLDKIRQKYFFSEMKKYTDLWCKTCPICQRVKRAHPMKHKVDLGEIKATRPFELFCIDIWDPLVHSQEGHTLVLTVIDAFTKFAWAIPLRDDKSSTIAKALFDKILSQYPAPERIHSDRGQNLISEVIKELRESFGIEKSMTTAYNPKGNGICERIHQFFRNAITSYTRTQRDWAEILPIIIRCYNDSCHSALDGLSPSAMIFGRKLGPQMLTLSEQDLKSPKAHISSLNLALLRAQESVIGFRDKQRQRKILKATPITDAMRSDLKTGDKVLVKVRYYPKSGSNPVESRKLYYRQRGPYTVSRVTQQGRVVRILDPFTGLENELPYSRAEVVKYHSRRELMGIDESSTEEEIVVNVNDDIPSYSDSEGEYQPNSIEYFEDDTSSTDEDLSITELEEPTSITELEEQSSITEIEIPVINSMENPIIDATTMNLPTVSPVANKSIESSGKRHQGITPKSTSSEKNRPVRPSRKCTSSTREDLIGRKISVYWPEQQRRYTGKVVGLAAANEDGATHDVLYDDWDGNDGVPVSEKLTASNGYNEDWEFVKD